MKENAQALVFITPVSSVSFFFAPQVWGTDSREENRFTPVYKHANIHVCYAGQT